MIQVEHTMLAEFRDFHSIFTQSRFYLRVFHILLGILSVETGILSLVASATLPQREESFSRCGVSKCISSFIGGTQYSFVMFL